MTPEEFIELPDNKKLELILSDGRELLERVYMFYVVKLYAYRGLYVEIWYQQISNRIDKVLLVDLDDVSHLYESQINISDLFKQE